MGQGLGRCERDVLLLLAMCRKLCDRGLQKFDSGAPDRKWLVAAAELEPDGRYARDIAAYDAGRIVELKRIKRETNISAPAMSRALHSLSRKGLVWRHAADLNLAGWDGRRTRHVSLTDAGIAAVAELSYAERTSARRTR